MNLGRESVSDCMIEERDRRCWSDHRVFVLFHILFNYLFILSIYLFVVFFISGGCLEVSFNVSKLRACDDEDGSLGEQGSPSVLLTPVMADKFP